MQSEITERAKTAWNSIADEFNQWDALGLDEQETYVALTAALSDNHAGEVKIKPLEWVTQPRRTFTVGSDFHYEISYFQNDTGSGWELIADEEYALGSFDHVPLAIAAAQSDYETRIRGALVDVPAVESEAVAWQPIDTAPKDWTDIILFDDERDPPVFSGYFSMEDGGKNCWMEDQGMGSQPVNPTHWQPLPTPPLSTRKGSATGTTGTLSDGGKNGG